MLCSGVFWTTTIRKTTGKYAVELKKMTVNGRMGCVLKYSCIVMTRESHPVGGKCGNDDNDVGSAYERRTFFDLYGPFEVVPWKNLKTNLKIHLSQVNFRPAYRMERLVFCTAFPWSKSWLFFDMKPSSKAWSSNWPACVLSWWSREPAIDGMLKQFISRFSYVVSHQNYRKNLLMQIMMVPIAETHLCSTESHKRDLAKFPKVKLYSSISNARW